MTSVHKDLLVVLIVTLITLIVALSVDIFELFSRMYEANIYISGVDELIFIMTVLFPVLVFFSYRRWREHIAEIALRKQVEGNLISQVRFFQTLIDTIPSPVFYKNLEGRYIGCNKAFEQFIQRPREEIIGKTVYEMAKKEIADIYYQKDRELFDNPGRQQYEWKTQDRKGIVHDVLFDKATFTDSNGDLAGLIGVITDITERKRLESEMLRSQKVESLGILAGGIAHDFNNLLTAILGNINLAAVQIRPDNPAVIRLDAAEKASLKAKDLALQLLAFSKGGASVKKIISLKQIIRDSLSFSLRGSNVDYECNLSDDLWLVEGDAGQLSQVFNNLVINASQAMPDGGTIRISAENFTNEGDRVKLKGGRYIKLSFRDEGAGIPEEDKSKIFDPYFTTKDTGSGLGLATSYAIVQKHDGLITVESEPGLGTTFTIYLPASQE